jgi:simple sugar transport system substrate-binding protein
MTVSGATRRQALRHIAVGTAAAALCPLTATRATAAADLTVGFVYIGPRMDWGWNQSFASAAAALATKPGVRIAEAPYLPESTDYGSGRETPETRAYTAALEGLIAEGAGLVLSTSFDEDPFLRAVAQKHPGVSFRQATLLPSSSNPSNLGSQNALVNQGHYVNGVAAGLCTKANKLGFVAGFPFGSVLLNVNSFLLGSRRTNPAATVQVIFTEGWEDEAHDAAATNTLIDAGCDVIGCHLDSPEAVIRTAESRGAKTCGHAFNQAPLAPKGYITGADYDWTGMFAGFAATLQRGGELPHFVTGGYDKGYVRSSPFGAGATPGAIAAARTAIAAMTSNEAIFAGPLDDNKGKRVIAAGTSYAPYADQLQHMDYLVEGVIGRLPE